MTLAALAIATALATQGCDAGPAAQASTAGAAAADHPDVTLTQARSAYESYLTSSDTAAAQGDEVGGLAVVADAAWHIASAQYLLRASASKPVTRYAYGTPTFYVPIVNRYPHWFMADVARRPLGSRPGSGTRTLMVFSQAKAGDPWLLDGDAAVEPGQRMPAIATDASGYAIAVPAYQQGLLLQPNVVGGTQAAVVDEGPANPAADLINPGPQTTGLYRQQAAVSAGTAKNLSYTWYMQGATFHQFALRTTSGDALVLYGMYLHTALEQAAGGTGPAIPVPANIRALFTEPDEVAAHGVYVDWTYEFASLDPAAGSGDAKVTVIAATGAMTSTHAS